jgi:hypothetical protein
VHCTDLLLTGAQFNVGQTVHSACAIYCRSAWCTCAGSLHGCPFTLLRDQLATWLEDGRVSVRGRGTGNECEALFR